MSDGDFEKFLRSARSGGTPSGDDARRVERKLSAKVSLSRALPVAAAAAFRAATAHASSASAQSSLGLGLRAWTKVLGATAALGLVAGTAYLATRPSPHDAPRAPAPSMVAPPVEAPGTAAQAPTLSAPATDPGVLVVDDPAKLPTASPEAKPPPPLARGSASATPSLDAELALLAQTSSALRGHDPAKALALVAAHDKTFPPGRAALGPEFAAQRVLSLAALGRRAEACAEARRFLEKTPNSPLAPQVRSTCDDPSSNP